MTTLRSRPCGRGGAGGTSPLAMRSVQSANIASARSRPDLIQRAASSARRPVRTACGGPTPSRRVGMSPSAFGISRVRLVAELMARQAAARLEVCGSTPPGLDRPARCRCRPAPLPGNSLFFGHAHQREPVAGGIVLARQRAGSAPATAVRFRILPGAVCTFGESTRP